MSNARSVSLPQSLTPAILAFAMALGKDGFNLLCAVLAVIGVIMAHLALNLLDDYFDYKVDMAGDRDAVVRKGFRAMTVKYPYLLDGSTSLKQLLGAICVFGGIAVACGLVILLSRDWHILLFAGIGAFLGFFYSAPPFKLAYRGLGELVIGVIFGPLLMCGVYYSACGSLDPSVILVSIPVGLLVLNILFTHSVIDLPADTESNKMTFARLIGSDRGNLIASAIINFVPFIIIIYGVIDGALHPLYLVSLLILPRAAWLFRSLKDFSAGNKDVTLLPKYLGRFENWEGICASGISWFMARWYTARNTLSGLCSLLVLVNIVLYIISLF